MAMAYLIFLRFVKKIHLNTSTLKLVLFKNIALLFEDYFDYHAIMPRDTSFGRGYVQHVAWLGRLG